MGLRNSSVLCLALFLAFSSCIHGLDITKLLGQYGEFTKFNKYLTETKLAEQINGQKAVTVLALDDSAVSSLAGKSQDAIKAILSTHVLVGDYDEKKLMVAQGSHEKLTTLSSASAIYVGLINEGEIAFAPSGHEQYNSKLVRTVSTEPGTVSILQVSEPIVAPGAAASSSSSPSPPSSSSPPPPSPSSSSPARPPSPAAPANKAAAAPAKAPVAEKKAGAPVAAASSPVVAETTTPVEETKPASAPAPSSGSRAEMGLFGGAVVALVSLFVSL